MTVRRLAILFGVLVITAAPLRAAWSQDEAAAPADAPAEATAPAVETAPAAEEPAASGEPEASLEIPNPTWTADEQGVMAPPPADPEAMSAMGAALVEAQAAEDEPIQLAQMPPAGGMAPLLMLQPGEVRTVAVDEISRVAVGNPAIVDVSVVSENELLVQAQEAGTSNIIIWDRAGQHTLDVTVAPALPQSVKLTVQLIEMVRDATDEIGVDWSDTITFAETTFGALDPASHSQIARLGEAFRFGSLSRTGASAVLSLLVEQGKAKVLAEPKLVASSGKSATAFIGVEVPVITVTSISSGTVSQNIEFKKTGVELTFQPTVLQGNDQIQLAVNARVSSIDLVNSIVVSGVTVPGFRIRQTETEIITGSGQSVFIAGLIQEEEKKNMSQVPGIGSIPVLGMLFRSTEFVRGQTELIIIITPRLRTQAEMVADRASSLDAALQSSAIAAQIRKKQ